ncbi:MAG: hypothetical protein HW380_3742 [Magnetococcales bacterium]|nr:hypothetical protein [Magnetococcales bacterium]HIJ85949.1 hypothetical protein [Magnetococcales bacterium]
MEEPQATPTVSVHEVTLENYGDIAKLLHNFRGVAHNREYWFEKFALWWDKNPLYEHSIPRGWLLRAGTEIVGFISCIPIPYQLAGEERLTYTASTWYVIPEYRKNGLILFLSLLKEASGTIIWNTTLNDSSRSVVERLYYQPIPYPFTQHFQVFTGIGAWLHDLSITRKWPQSLQWRLESFHKWQVGGNLARPQKTYGDPLRVERLDHAGAVFDRLWQRTRADYPTTRIRNAASVNWYCFGLPSRVKVLFGCFQGEDLTGFAIFSRRIVRGYPYLECFDLWIDPSITQTGDVLFDAAMYWAANNEYRGLVSYDYPWIRDWLNNRRWKIVTQGHPGGVMKGPENLLQSIRKGACYFVYGEGDLGL